MASVFRNSNNLAVNDTRFDGNYLENTDKEGKRGKGKEEREKCHTLQKKMNFQKHARGNNDKRSSLQDYTLQK